MINKYSLVGNVIWILLMILCAISCSREDDNSADQTITVAKADSATTMWNEELDNFREWDIMPGTTKQMIGKGWHTAFATVRGNDIALTAVAKNVDEMPTGSILIKENFDEAGSLMNIVVMRRNEEGWFWAQFEPKGEVTTSGLELGSCVSCHGMAPNNNVFTWKKEITTGE